MSMQRLISAILLVPFLMMPSADASSGPVCGVASWYSDSLKGQKTASGKRYNPDAFVSAHRTLPFGTRLIVKEANGDKFVEVTVIDRGPHRKSRIIDLSKAAARKLGFGKRGLKRVCIERVQ
ncbi:MAG TPA: septal ring lytic transglycosylase RlpA family protein [Hyphomicrobiales bacterium]|nr:septal ring lytic transglycosylase RlpA family protein [Hyphomicrobiales bacterium]